MIDLETMQLLGAAVQAVQTEGTSPAEGLLLIKLVERRIDELGEGVTYQETMEVLGNAATVYEGLGMLDVAAERLTRLCGIAERTAPNTAETAGDYSRLAMLLERHGDIEDAILALERSAEHIKGAGLYERYAPGYEGALARLRGAGQ